MLRKLLLRLMERRYYWRNVGFSQLAELYANRMLRLMAVNMFSGIMGIFMYQLGYELWHILLFFTIYFAVRMLATLPSAFLIARIGPKHATLVSNILYIPGLVSMTQLQGSGLGALVVYLLIVPFAVSLYNVAYHVGFSKVKHSVHAGKELSFMYISEKAGAALSPIIGGLVAFWFGPEATLWAASVIFLLSSAPLFLSPEAVMTKQQITFRGFNWRDTWRQLLSAVAVGVDQLVSGGVWALFVGVAIFGTTSDIVYAEVGGLISLSVAASIIFSRLYGALVDRNRGGLLLKSSVVADSSLHVARALLQTPLAVVMVNILNEAATVGYALPYTKGEYDMADNLPGYRIVYISMMDMAICFGATLFGGIVTLLCYGMPGVEGMQTGFLVAAVLVLGVMVHNFPALRRRSIFSR